MFFDNDEKVERLRVIAATWLGTPFMMNGRVKQAGVSCQHLPIEILKECGMKIEWTPPPGTGGAADQEKENRMSKFISETGQFQRVSQHGYAGFDFLQPGDMLTFRVVNGEYHLGLFLRRDMLSFIHTISPYGVSYSNLYDPTYGDRFLTAWRPLA